MWNGKPVERFDGTLRSHSLAAHRRSSRQPASQWLAAPDAAERTNAAAGMFVSASQRAPLLALLHGLEHGEPLIVITGETGVGKTTLLESVLPAGEGGGTQRIWHRGKDDRQLTRTRVLSEISAQGLPGDAPGSLLAGQSRQCRRTILVIDDAHLLTPEAIGTLIGILDMAAAGSGQLQLVLVGRPMLWNRLRRAAVVDRVKVSGEMTGLPPSEARDYLRERLRPTGTPFDGSPTEDSGLALPSRARWTPVELNAIVSDAAAVPPGQGARATAHEIVKPASPASSAVARARQQSGAAPGVPGAEPGRSATPRLMQRAAMAAAMLAILAAGALYWARLPTPAARAVAERSVPKPDAPPASLPARQSAASVTSSARLASTAPTAPMSPFAAPRPGLPRQPAPPPAGQRPQNVASGMGASAAATGPAPAATVQAAASAEPGGPAAAQLPDTVDAASQPSVPTLTAAQVDDLLQRGEAMLARGDVIAARVLYKRAALANSAAAAMILGKTYDPVFLAGIGAATIRPAPSTAASWYLRAAELGDREAQERLLRLRSKSSQVAGNN